LEQVPGPSVASGTGIGAVAHAAAAAGAAHALLFTVEEVQTRPGITPGQTFVVGRVRGQGMSRGRSDPSPEVEISLARQEPSAEQALAGIGEEGVRILVQQLLLDVVESGVVQELASAEPHTLTSEQRQAANTLYERRDRTAQLREAAAGFTEQCERVETLLAAEQGAAGVRCFGDPCAEEYAVDLFPDGQTALVQVEQKSCRYFLDHPTWEEAVLVPERLDLISLADGSRRVLDTAQNYYGFASVSPSSDRVVFVENYGRDYALVELALASDARRVLRLVRRPERVAFPRISPDGGHISFLYRLGKEQYRVFSMDSAGGEPVELSADAYHHEWVEVPWGTGGRKSLLAVVVLGAGEPDPEQADAGAGPPPLTHEHLVLFEPGDPTGFATVGGSEWPVSGLAGARGYEIYFSSNSAEHGCRLGVFDINTRQTRFVEAPLCMDSVTLAPDGAVLGLANRETPEQPYGPGVELVRFDPATRRITRLTDNRHVERGVTAARGGYVLFEKQPERFHTDFPLVNVCAASLASPESWPAFGAPDAGVE
jgi:hypothetical protein